MGIGVSVFLLAIGAILAFAVNTSINGLDIAVVGYILMAAGLLGIVLFLTIYAPRTRRPVAEETVVRERPLRDRDVY